MTTILLTGGAGYIGKALHAAGFAPVVYDDLSRGNPEAVKWGEAVVGGLGDCALLAGRWNAAGPPGSCMSENRRRTGRGTIRRWRARVSDGRHDSPTRRSMLERGGRAARWIQGGPLA